MKIGFLALAQAHQHLHWIPAALELSRRRGIQVDVLCPSRAGIRFIRTFDPERRLNFIWLPASWRDGLFQLPPRGRVLRFYRWIFSRYPILVTTETTSTRLRNQSGFRSALIRIRHGVGDAATRTDDSRLSRFDLSLVGGEKDKRRLISAGQCTEDSCAVSGYAKFELVKPPHRLFRNDNPVALYNPHWREDLSSWHTQGAALVREMERLNRWNFIIAPHVRLRSGPTISTDAPNIIIDRGSVRSIDMTYTQAASVYIGDASSQLYEFLNHPRPCIFVNGQGVDWQRNENWSHFALGQVIDAPSQLPAALERADAVQPIFEPLQTKALEQSIDRTGELASKRQADAILSFARQRGMLD